MRLVSFLNKPPQRAASFIPNRVGYAVGDIHGRDDLLGELLNQLEASAAADVRAGCPPLVVFLGDYIDRGPNPRAVVDMLLSSRPHGFERHFLMGNHEQALLAFFEAPNANRGWVFHGGVETMRSYGVQPPPAGAPDEAWVESAAALKAAIPAEHLAFLSSLDRYLALGDYVFVHAGVDVSKPLSEQTDLDLFWSRGRFLRSKRRFSHRVVHGHTPVDQAYADVRRICVDTGAYATGVLTALRLEGEGHSFITARAKGP